MNQDVAVIKGVGIILMVLGHAIAIYNDYSVLYNFIYMFHMPLFFFCTGYFIKDKYVLNIDGLVVFITKKVKSVWVKYVVWSLLLILLHNYLVNLYFYSPEYSSSFGSYWDTEHIFTCAKNALLLKYNSDPLLGGFWFLNVLFYSSIISVLTIYVLRKIFFFFDEDKTNNSLMIYLLSFISLFIISILWSFFITRDIPFVSINQRHFFCAAYMVSGKIFYEIQNKVSLPNYFPFCGLAILGISSCFGFKTDATFYMKDNGGGIVIDYLYSMLGVISVFEGVRIFNCKSKYYRSLSYIGQHTLIIFILHLIAFKIVSYIICLYYTLPIAGMAMFPTVHGVSIPFLWIIAYLLVGVIIPLFFNKCYSILKEFYERLFLYK